MIQQIVKNNKKNITTQIRKCEDFSKIINILNNCSVDLKRDIKVIDSTEVVIAYNSLVDVIEDTYNNSKNESIDPCEIVIAVSNLLNAINRLK